MSLKDIRYEHKPKEMDYWDDGNRSVSLQASPHLHREIELIYYLCGKTEACVDAHRCEPQAGDVFLTFPNQIHSYQTVEREKFLIFIFRPEMIPEFLEIFNTGIPRSPLIRGANALPRVDALFRMLGEACAQPNLPNAELLQRGYLLALFSELLPQMEITRIQTGDSAALRSIVSYCSKNFNTPLSLKLLEENLHLNKYYISHLFSKRLGMSFNDYVNSLRVSEACRYLLNSNLSVTEIGNLAGFNTLRTFNRAFIKQTGVSPSEYRKSNVSAARRADKEEKKNKANQTHTKENQKK